MKYTIEDLKNGKCAVINDGTVEELREVLKLAFPKSPTPTGYNIYYERFNEFSWTDLHNTCLPTQSVKDFLKQDMELKTTKERILEAASKCSDAKGVLKTLFPEAFNEIDDIKPFEIDFNSTKLIFIAAEYAPKGLSQKSFGLSQSYTWSLTENKGYQILVPKKK